MTFDQVFFDFDSTLVSIEGIDELAKFLGCPEVAEYTTRSMSGTMDVREAYQKRLELLNIQSYHLEALGEFYKANILDGAKELVQVLRELQKEVIIISGGFKAGIDPVAELLGIQRVYALELEFNEAGFELVDSPLLGIQGKIDLVQMHKSGRAVYVGDGMTDYVTHESVEMMIPYYGIEERPFVKECGFAAYGSHNLLGLLPMILSPEELKLAASEFPEEVQLACDLIRDPQNSMNYSVDLPLISEFASRKFLVPGPTDPAPEFATPGLPMIGHRSDKFARTYSSLQESLQKFLGWKGPFLIGNCSATGMMEAVLRSLPKSKVLSLQTGAFAKRFETIARRVGHEVHVQEAEERFSVAADELELVLEQESYDIVLITHSETSNGILNPVEKLARTVKRNSEALVIVDGVSSVGGIPIENSNIDAIVFGSQKCLSIAPGVGLLWTSEKLRNRVEEGDAQSFYLDLKQYYKYHDQGAVPYTPAVSELQQMEIQLKRYLENQDHFVNYKENASYVWEQCQKLNLEIWAEEPYRSLTVTSIRLPQIPDFLKSLRLRGFELASGYGPWKKTHFRIGHMGLINKKDLQDLFQEMEEIIHG